MMGAVWEMLLVLGIVMERQVAHGQVSHWVNGHATFYGSSQSPATLGGACGYDNTIHAGFGVHTTALSGVLFRNGQACGACYQLKCNCRLDPKWCLRHAVVTVTATNLCATNNNGGWCDPPHHHFDMSMPFFSCIARQGNKGIVPILYRRYEGIMSMTRRTEIHHEGTWGLQHGDVFKCEGKWRCEGCMGEGKNCYMGAHAKELGCKLAK
ncbi:Expansin-A12 [Ancistrocladus abbreviatus]